ncbi:signal transduction histidine kinase [Mucilaginibacter frigoritolerans]|uniref:histidine kinase n=1 Tax=Mucilaginibacter frigoritolerans TaxID=652788 RepID=A0A562TS72_9SPHI|nr:HAMP domain-containing sensor histidine kinase [Mucilaginibacter frigoritolerans]TWI95936.1 signal transduction histidine kinase [Mucilaginibacter frigoritolerans]
MKVKDRLSLQFTFMFAVLLLVVLTGIYLFVEHNRVKTFFDKLDDRAVTVGQFYLAEDNLSKENFKSVIKKFPQSLSDETIRIYDDQFHAKFIHEGTLRWDTTILKGVVSQKLVHITEGNRQITGIYYVDNSGNYIIMVSAIDHNGYHYIYDLGLIMFFFFLASLFITYFMGSVFSRIALIPIVKITSNLKRIRSTSLDLRLPIATKKKDEIDVLSLTINNLLEHLEQSFESQKSFIANASHELRTPITTILGEAEITLMHERTNEDYKSTLSNIIKETERLNYIINSLMDLMQTNAANYEFQPIRMDELIWEIKDELSVKGNENNINIKYNLPYDPAKYSLMGNRQLLFIGISNIIKNALKFSDNKEIYCEIHCDIKGIHVTITDNGIGIEPKDISKIFQPFFRSTNALYYPGYGIGLSLTNNIIRLHNGTVEVESELNKGTTFHLIFPNL